MDSGEEIPGLGEDWSFLGAKLFEWLAGFPMFLIVSELAFKGAPAKGMPVLMMVWIGTTVTLATLRQRFPDEERGLMNLFATKCGVEPPGIPTPAELQPYWSGAPLQELDEKCEFRELRLFEFFDEYSFDEEDEERLVSPAGM